VVVETVWSDLMKVAKFLESKGVAYASANFEYIPSVIVTLDEFDKALKVHTLIETLEEDEDVAAVWHNAHIPENLVTEIINHIEKTRFRT
jgi:transcriptional/translational regulatory protein YebC/TACO1